MPPRSPSAARPDRFAYTGDDVNDDQLLRYSRQIMLPEIDAEGQLRLADARVLVIGLGGLGSAASVYLTVAGVGHLTLVDFDKVDLSNLQRIARLEIGAAPDWNDALIALTTKGLIVRFG